jgi:glycine/D-amino acid oxidase-like deaminating enzyme
VFRHAVFWEKAASVSDPLGVTRAYARRFAVLGGIMVKGDAMSLHRSGPLWRVETAQGPIDAESAVVALGPWAPDLLKRHGIALPFAVKRGYHRHFGPSGNAGLGGRPLWRGGTSPNVPAAPTAAAIISSVAPALLIASTTLSSKVGHVMGHAPHSPKAGLR